MNFSLNLIMNGYRVELVLQVVQPLKANWVGIRLQPLSSSADTQNLGYRVRLDRKQTVVVRGRVAILEDVGMGLSPVCFFLK